MKSNIKLIINKKDAPEIVVEESWVHTGLGSLTELSCTVYAQPPAQVCDVPHVHPIISLSSLF